MIKIPSAFVEWVLTLSELDKIMKFFHKNHQILWNYFQRCETGIWIEIVFAGAL